MDRMKRPLRQANGLAAFSLFLKLIEEVLLISLKISK